MDTTASAPSRPRVLGRALVPLAGILLLSTLPVGLYLVYEHTLRALGAGLSSGLGLSVRIERGIWGNLSPALVLAGVELRLPGQQGEPALRIDRVVVELSASLGQVAPRRVRLIRPELRLSDRELERWLAGIERAPAPREPARVRARRGRSAQPVRVTIEDGSLDLRLDLRGRGLRLRGDAIHCELRRDAAGWRSPARLVVGRSRVSLADEPLLELAASGIDLDLRRLVPTRIAVLGGQLRLPAPGPGGPARFALHSFTVLPVRGGASQLELHAKPAGRGSGRIALRLRLDRRPPPGAELARLSLDDLDLSELAPHLDWLGVRTRGARVRGSVWATRGGDGLQLRTRLELHNLTVAHKLVAPEPVGPLHTRIEATIALDRRGLSIAPARISLGELALEGSARVRPRPDGEARLALTLRLASTPCQRVLASLPPRFVPALQGMALSGSLGGSARLELDTAELEAGELDVRFDPLGCRVTADPSGADANRLRTGAVTIRVSGTRGAGMDWTLGPENPHFTPLPKISPHVRNAFIAAEDSRFFTHHGFDPQQLKRAFFSNLKEGRMMRGASTISQQLIKNIFLDQRRNLSRKVQEAVLTWRLEQVVPKQRILELYLNLVEMGPGVYGVGQAARAYFKRSASELSRLQAAQLAALTPSPRHLAPKLREGTLGQAWTDKIQTLLRIMRRTQPRTPAAPQQLSSL
jgi:monofunctional biosynthetic peptidoglycan transglycosylase